LRPSYKNSEYLIDIADNKMAELGERVDRPLEHHILKKNLVDSNRAMREIFPVKVLKEYVLNKLKKPYELLIWKKNFCKYLTINCFTSKCFFNGNFSAPTLRFPNFINFQKKKSWLIPAHRFPVRAPSSRLLQRRAARREFRDPIRKHQHQNQVPSLPSASIQQHKGTPPHKNHMDSPSKFLAQTLIISNSY
jgi:hypothetical protein